jgi:hypothetical protein
MKAYLLQKFSSPFRGQQPNYHPALRSSMGEAPGMGLDLRKQTVGNSTVPSWYYKEVVTLPLEPHDPPEGDIGLS